jgi:hypothetical protein
VLEPKTHSFIVKVWLEERGADGRAVWRGHITHVPSGARHYFDRLAAIKRIIAPYLESLGVPPNRRTQLRGWLVARVRRLARKER